MFDEQLLDFKKFPKNNDCSALKESEMNNTYQVSNLNETWFLECKNPMNVDIILVLYINRYELFKLRRILEFIC
jgi:hypothetical protein